MRKPALLILAAGMGRRYGGLKQLDPLGFHGETIIDYTVYDAIRAGFGKAVFVIRPFFETAFRDQVMARFEPRIESVCAFQELEEGTGGYPVPPSRSKPWGTGHAVLASYSLIEEPFAVVNADDFYGRKSLASICEFLKTGQETIPSRYAMVGYRLRNTLSDHGSVSRGICRFDESLRLTGVVETTRIFREREAAYSLDRQDRRQDFTGDEIASMNLWGFNPCIFSHLRREFGDFLAEHGTDPEAEFFLPSVVNNLTARGLATVQILPTEDSWFGITYREDRENVRNRIRSLVCSGAYPEDLWGRA